jgi:thiol:disulfide interchange protein DsbC
MKQSNRRAAIGWCGLAAGLSLVFSSVAMAAPTKQNAEIELVRQGISKLLSGHPVKSVVPSPIPGVYEVMVGPQLYYVSADGKYLLNGKLFDMASRTDLTTPKEEKAKAEAIDAVGEDNMVIFAPKDYKYTITVFTDIDCGYCRKLHSQIKQYNDLGIRVRYLSFPRAGIGSDSYKKAVDVWCSSDRKAALTAAKAGGKLEEKQCDNPVADQYALGQMVGVTGTPAIFLSDGELVPGYVPPAKMAAILKQKSQQ